MRQATLLRCAIAACALAAQPLHAQEFCQRLRVTNPTAGARANEPVVVSLSALHGLGFVPRSARVATDEGELACQLDDLDDDGTPDEAAFVISLRKRQTATCRLILSADTLPAQPERLTYAEMMLDDKRGRHPHITRIEAPGASNLFSDLYPHGVALESSRTAYRVYFDHRQNIDIYGKRHARLELPQSHFYATPELQAQGFGNDVLWAGQSIACGTLRPWTGSAPGDWRGVAARGMRIVASGAVRSVAELTDRMADGNVITTRYTVYAGRRDLRVDVSARRPLRTAALCTGVQRVGSDCATLQLPSGLAATYGTDHPEQSSDAMRERFPAESVGLAVCVPERYVASHTADPLNCLFVIGAGPLPSFHYHVSFAAAKETFDALDNARAWFAHAREWQQQLTRPAEVELVP